MKIVGVTSCPAGLAHTPMAAKALENAGKQLGHEIKIEQQGIMGQVNGITAEEARQADLCIIASNQHINDAERFSGIPTVRVEIGRALKNAEQIITKAVALVEKKKSESQ
ncbi:PTS fructose transporter subunit IIB [Bacillus sp. A015]|uniref:PTS fructose transporter subunit IIB n=1 Tax=Bacillus pumilus TaxID=1408 RepID=A0A2G8IXP7_BACPU|nr:MULTISPECIES: fructose PTS transporter subunit IIB [Bacillus]MCC9089615.1 fructose PTS transporter subunit IIB [Bacillus pumilus]MDR7250111.1 PTS system fructose-specific IIB component [Bacillus pumilus]MED1747718.1 fructose PTS transporter subunit IIB [Bacillus zhangzhouensis]PIK28263.1 PTS fructose transporter subunit IIB [Bacillus pumilus]PRS62305.1 PTS fructose transporter subunit IIB [Bacillus pumilus]